MPERPSVTLGDILYARQPASTPQERGWVGLLRRVALRDHVALHALYERSSAIMFAIAFRLTGDRVSAEVLTVDVYRQLWHRAGSYSPAEGTVLGWIAAQARTKALERLRLVPRKPGAEVARLDELTLAPALQQRLARLIAGPVPAKLPEARQWIEPAWEEVAAGISCQLLASDSERRLVSMLVRLAPGAAYPAHTHAAREELHLLEGELWIDERLLQPGDYYSAEPGSADGRVWSDTGCACLLVTSESDSLS